MKLKHTMKRSTRLQTLGSVLLVLFIVWQVGATVLPNISLYTERSFTDETYSNLDQLFNDSQYRQRSPKAIIPDETLFKYASAALLRGGDPIHINSEHTPLGKYFIAVSIWVFQNDKFIVLPFGILTLLSLFLLSRKVFGSVFLSLVPVALFAREPLFLDQFRYAPLLDIIQLPFIFFCMYFFLLEQKHNRYFFTSLFLGFVVATKTIVPGILLMTVFTAFFIIRKQVRSLAWLLAAIPVSLAVFIASYTRTFMSGYSLADFIGFQKWIFLYQKSKILYPFSAWRLIFLNQWQTWWGDESILKAVDWQITWPIFTTLAAAAVGVWLLAKKDRGASGVLLLLWATVYAAFLSIGVVSSRFFLPFLPVVYILGIQFIVDVYEKRAVGKTTR